MANFKPMLGFSIPLSEMEREGLKSNYISMSFPSYKELKKSLAIAIHKSRDSEVTVTRSRRGEWGEWYEHWTLDKTGKPVILDEGWM